MCDRSKSLQQSERIIRCNVVLLQVTALATKNTLN